MNATAEVIEGVARDVTDVPERGLVVVHEPRAHLVSGLGAVMALSDDQFDKNLEMLAKAKVRAQQLQKALLTEGTDYGTVPGIPRPFLHKPGAETFEKAYGFATSYAVERKVGDGVKTPELEYIVHAKVHLGDTEGPVVGEGLGSCNTHESKYRYRQAKPTCPDCGKDTVIKGKPDGKLKGKWWCGTREGGCGHTFPADDKRLTEQATGQVENENPWDLANTILKMARKRAGVDGILTATGTSGLFTQDDDSPAVQRDAAQSGATAGQGEAQGRGQSAGGQAQAQSLPAVPQDITAETSLGIVTFEGQIVIGDRAPGDGLLRQSPKGPVLGIRFELPNGTKISQVLTRGPLAAALALTVSGNPERLKGVAAEVTGEMFAVPWQKQGEAMPPFRRVEVSRIKTDDWILPGPEAPAAPAAEKKRGGKKADAAVKEPAPAKPEATDAGGEQPASAGPGMTAAALTTALDGARISPAYAASVAKSKFGGDDLAALTDAQRLELAGELGILAEEEEES